MSSKLRNIAVVGAGKMGLPISCFFASQGANVVALDNNSSLVSDINEGLFHSTEPGLDRLLATMLGSGSLKVTLDANSALSNADAVVVLVPALLTAGNEIDLSNILEVSKKIAEFLRPGMLVAYETTLQVGTTSEKILPILESTGLEAGVDFTLCFSPERIKSGRIFSGLSETPKIVGGVTRSCTKKGASFYREYLGVSVLEMESPEEAEMAKLIDMIYRDVNIALVNELARFSRTKGIEIKRIIDVANSSGEAHLLQPGIGVGGHCTPVYPYFLTKPAAELGQRQSIAESAREINDTQFLWLLDLVERDGCMVESSRVLILGLGFRPGVKEASHSPSLMLYKELHTRGASEVAVADPLFNEKEMKDLGLVLGELSGRDWDMVILVTAHDEFLNISGAQLEGAGVKVFVDGRNAIERDSIESVGVRYYGI
jgi:nucleotide sugar dehydrogenase